MALAAKTAQQLADTQVHRSTLLTFVLSCVQMSNSVVMLQYMVCGHYVVVETLRFTLSALHDTRCD
jgi:hypothetical protein